MTTSATAGARARTRDGGVPGFVTDFLVEYVAARGLRPRRVLGLWAASGWLLPPLAEAWPAAAVVGVLAGAAGEPLRQRFDRAGGIAWRSEPEREVVATTDAGLDVVVGCPPWHWQPRYLTLNGADGTVVLTEDEANAALLESCMRLARDGVGLFIVGPGFLMRPGPGTAMANLARFGLALELLLELPRGVFEPDSGSGRLLIGLGHRGGRRPVIGSVTEDPESVAPLLQAVERQRANTTER